MNDDLDIWYNGFFDCDLSNVDINPNLPIQIVEETPEFKYLELCLIDFKDDNRLEILDKIHYYNIYIKIDGLISNTLTSYKNYYNNISNDINNIDECLLKFRIKYPHTNVTISIIDNCINLKLEI